ncbi:MAG: cytochrome c [Myxococcales bacterium]|nr:cytochrome c [Myxococcales bacterium]
MMFVVAVALLVACLCVRASQTQRESVDARRERSRTRALVFIVALVCVGCRGPTAAESQRAARVLSLPANRAAGQALYSQSCAVCHGADGRGTLATDLRGAATGSPESIVFNLLWGPESMPAFDGWSDQQLADVTDYVRGTIR